VLSTKEKFSQRQSVVDGAIGFIGFIGDVLPPDEALLEGTKAAAKAAAAPRWPSNSTAVAKQTCSEGA